MEEFMDRAAVVRLDTEEITRTLENSALRDSWQQLVDLLGDESIPLLKLVCSVEPTEDISKLRKLEMEQANHGAGFLGMLPAQIPADLGVPIDLKASLDLAMTLAEIRAANLRAISETMPQYAMSFAGGDISLEASSVVPTEWKLDIDASGIRAVLGFFASNSTDEQAALTIARMPAFTEMMRHRCDLGYVPEPLINAKDFAWCLTHAASTDPIDQIWKWLHPQNLFDLSDLYANRDQYCRLLNRLEGDGRLEQYILGEIAQYAPDDTVFQDRLAFAVGWGIRGWATVTTGGINVEHVKDNWCDMLPTLVHETFHRLQTSIAQTDPTIDEPGFEQITSYPLNKLVDRRLYRALSYIMLEGSATYVATQKWIESWIDDAKEGLQILKPLYKGKSADLENNAYDELLSKGLRSNGPFYGFGALLSHAIVKVGGRSSLGVALRSGAPSFFLLALNQLDDKTFSFPDALITRIESIQDEIEAGRT
jgi:hypothetical protein